MSIGERVKSARHASGMSLRDLADKVGVSHTAISKYEHDLNVPGSDVLLRLAAASGVSVDYLLRPASVKVETPTYRKRQCLPAKAERAVIGRIQEGVERHIEAEALFLGAALAFARPEGFPQQVRTLEQAEAASGCVREAWDLGLDPIEDMTALLEDRGVRVQLVFGDDKFDACTFWADGSPVIAANRAMPGDRQRLSLAHELGHLMLEVDEVLGQEKAAMRFASSFLVPAEAARRELGGRRSTLDPLELHMLKHKWGLSMQGWVYRAKDLGILSETAAVRHFKQFRQRGWHKQEPGDQLATEEPQRLAQLVLRGLAEDLISESRASELLGMPLRRFLRDQAERHEGIAGDVGC